MHPPAEHVSRRKKATSKLRHEGFIHTREDGNFYHLARPTETSADRFEAYMAFLREQRPGCLVEVTTISSYDGYNDEWFPILKKHKFKRVTKFFNSNSKNEVTVWHCIIVPAKTKAKKNASPPPWSATTREGE